MTLDLRFVNVTIILGLYPKGDLKMKKLLFVLVLVLVLSCSLFATNIDVYGSVRLGFEKYLDTYMSYGELKEEKATSLDIEFGNEFFFYTWEKDDFRFDFGVKVDFILAEVPLIYMSPLATRFLINDTFAVGMSFGFAPAAAYLTTLLECSGTYYFSSGTKGVQFLMRFVLDEDYPPKQFCIGYVMEF